MSDLFHTLAFADLQALVMGMLRVGRVSSVDASNATARVVFPGDEDVVSYDLPIVVAGASRSMNYWVPVIDEQVLCLFLPSAIEQGFIIGGFYSQAQTPPINDAGAHVLAGDTVHLGDATADDPVVRKSDLQKAIDDLKAYTDDAIDGHTHTVTGASQTGGSVTGATDSTIWSGPPAPNAQSSDKVFSS